jgi:hypothetical protein
MFSGKAWGRARMSNVATIIGCGASLVGALFWLWASFTTIPPFPDVGWDSGSWVFEPVRNALRSASRRNAVAAFFSGIAAFAFAVANYPMWF